MRLSHENLQKRASKTKLQPKYKVLLTHVSGVLAYFVQVCASVSPYQLSSPLICNFTRPYITHNNVSCDT